MNSVTDLFVCVFVRASCTRLCVWKATPCCISEHGIYEYVWRGRGLSNCASPLSSRHMEPSWNGYSLYRKLPSLNPSAVPALSHPEKTQGLLYKTLTICLVKVESKKKCWWGLCYSILRVKLLQKCFLGVSVNISVIVHLYGYTTPFFF